MYVMFDSAIWPFVFQIPKGVDIDNLGLIVHVPMKTLQTLQSTKGGKLKSEYIASDEFVRSVKVLCNVYYNKKTLECWIFPIRSPLYISRASKCILSSLPSNVVIHVLVPLSSINKYKKTLVDSGFHRPYKYENTLSWLTPSKPHLVFRKINNVILDTIHRSDAIFSIDTACQLVSQACKTKHELMCSISIRLSKKTSRVFKLLHSTGNSLNGDNSITQKELAGRLIINRVKNGTYVLCIDKPSIKHGSEESVDGLEGNFTFHTHPIEAYINHGFKYAWPSNQDYNAVFMSIPTGLAAHFVFSREGIYVIQPTNSLLVYIHNNQSSTKYIQDISSVIMDKYLMYKKKLTLPMYLSYANSVKYNKIQLFNVSLIQYTNDQKIKVSALECYSHGFVSSLYIGKI